MLAVGAPGAPDLGLRARLCHGPSPLLQAQMPHALRALGGILSRMAGIAHFGAAICLTTASAWRLSHRGTVLHIAAPSRSLAPPAAPKVASMRRLAMQRFIFPRWSNKVLPLVFFLVLGPSATAAVAGVWYYATNKHLEVGYQPKQPVQFSHKLHAGDLGMDCRYCHHTVERSAMAAVPPTQTCMNCHTRVRTDSPLLAPVRDSAATDQPIHWIRVHNLPDYAYFDHSAHMLAGVGCSSCHGRIDQMPRVTQVQPLSMGWCLDCHRDPGPNLRSKKDITNMAWEPTADAPPLGEARTVDEGRVVNPPQHCSGCHR